MPREPQHQVVVSLDDLGLGWVRGVFRHRGVDLEQVLVNFDSSGGHW